MSVYTWADRIRPTRIVARGLDDTGGRNARDVR